MEEIIKKIISIENKAQKVMSSTNVEKKEKELALKEKLQQLEKNIIENAYKKVEQIRERELAETNLEAKKETERCNNIIIRMEERASRKEKIWRKEIIDAIIKR
jgi:hypothetical protein